MLEELVPKYLDTVSTDTDRSIAMTALHCIQEMLDSIGEPVLRVSEDCFTTIISVVKNVLRGKVCAVKSGLSLLLRWDIWERKSVFFFGMKISIKNF